jgi:mannose-6-phosphate isomerase-like protein (cupin superfamily)
MKNVKVVRRIVTGHDETGKAVILFDSPTPHCKIQPVAETASYGIWATDRVPSLARGGEDHWDDKLGVPPPVRGTSFKVVDFPPTPAPPPNADNSAFQRSIGKEHISSKARAPRHPAMHRTRSVDYGIVLSGEIVMLLDDTEVPLAAGDVIVQQATNHAWINRSDTVCRMAFVQIDAEEPLV